MNNTLLFILPASSVSLVHKQVGLCSDVCDGFASHGYLLS